MENVVVGSSQVDGWKIGNVEMHVSVGMRILGLFWNWNGKKNY